MKGKVKRESEGVWSVDTSRAEDSAALEEAHQEVKSIEAEIEEIQNQIKLKEATLREKQEEMQKLQQTAGCWLVFEGTEEISQEGRGRSNSSTKDHHCMVKVSHCPFE